MDYPFLNETNKQCMESVSFDNLLKMNFTSYNATEENEILYNLFKTTIMENYSGEENLVVISQDSNVFQLTNSLNELNTKNGKNSNNYSLSMIDLGDCGEALKKAYHISEDTPLIIFKLEKYGEVASKKNIQYEVYNPYTKEKMDLSICDDEKVDIYIPVTLSEETEKLHNDLLNYGYDLFNPNDSFYQDICTPFTSINGTDVVLSDRKNNYFNDTETSCQDGCEYSSYSKDTGHLKCECSVVDQDIQTQTTNNKFNEKIILSSFYDVIKYSNYKLFKCYKIVFDKNKLKYNYGSYIFIVYFILYIIFNFFFYARGFYYIKIYSTKIFYSRDNVTIIKPNNKRKRKSNFNIYSPKKGNFPPKKKKSSRTVNEFNKTNSEKSVILHQNLKGINKDINVLNKKNPKTRNSVIILNNNKTSFLESYNKLDSNSRKKSKKRANEKIIKFNKKDKMNMYDISNNIKNKNIKKEEDGFSFFRGNNFVDFELNELEYKKAIEYDKRSFLRYYWSLIRREHLIFFTFFSYNDYNILSVKLSKCIFAIATDFALNVVFFFDDTMSKIYLDYGKYNFIALIPQAIYSTVVSEALDVFLRYLCLTEKAMYRIKKIEKNRKKNLMNDEFFKILKCIKIKLFVYFALTHILFAVYWYFVSAFCAVYKNTQMILFKDSFVSLFLSLLYPFGLYLLPTSFRIISLRDKKKSLKCLYKSSDIIPLI